MLSQANAFFPSSMNSGGTASSASRASLSAARSCSSSQMSRTACTSGFAGPSAADLAAFDLKVAERGECRGTAQFFQATGTLRADAADGDRHGGADFRVRVRGVADQHGQQLPAARGQAGKGGAQRGVQFRLDDLLLDLRSGLIRERLAV